MTEQSIMFDLCNYIGVCFILTDDVEQKLDINPTIK